MFIDFGSGVLVISFVLALFAVAAAMYGHYGKSGRWVESARRAMQLTFPLLSLSTGTLIYLLVSGHYEVQFVYSVTSDSMPLYLKITALWGGQEGSLLFWAWLMSAFASAVTLRKWDRDREFLPWVVAVTSITLAFFLMLIIFFENPFARWWIQPNGEPVAAMFQPAGSMPAFPPDGQGLNPLLRHPGMIIHPPMLYLGFVSFVIPYAFAIAALVTGRTDDRWLRLTRRWTLVAWLFLSLGLVLGARWAYDLLGWGGYWFWDPVEVAALMPWLAGTPFLHSVMIQEKRGMLKQWNMILIVLTYCLVIYGTFLTRSGVLSSVHAFAQSAIGPLFFAFIVISLITSAVLIIWRWADLRSENEVKSLYSREVLFLLNNLIFVAVLVVCIVGIHAPLFSEWITGEKITMGPPYYELANSPLFAILMLLMAIAPLSAWGLASEKHMGQINRPVLWSILAVPIILAGIFWSPLSLQLGGTTQVIIAVLVVDLILAGIYLFRRAIWQSALFAAVVTALLAAFYAQNVIALIGFFLVALVIAVTVLEFWRGARARQKVHGETFFLALGRLTARNRRRYAGYIIHLAMVIMAIGILGIETIQTETQRNLAVGESVTLGDYTFRYDSLAQFPYTDGRQVTRAVVSVHKDGNFLGELYPRADLYPSGQPMTIPGLRSTLGSDLYVVLVNWESISISQTPFKIFYNPLVNWLWIGSLVFTIGALLAAWPQKED